MVDIRLKRAINGDINAYQEIIEEMKVYMYAIAIKFLKNDIDAADAISNTVIISYENLKKVKKLEFFKTWFTRILINECKKILIFQNKTVLIDDYEETLEIETTIDIEQSIDIKNYLKQIPPQQKSVILLYYYEEMSIEEIANLLEIPVGTVKSRLFTARNNLKKIIEKKGE